jgi:hypothetical protein
MTPNPDRSKYSRRRQQLGFIKPVKMPDKGKRQHNATELPAKVTLSGSHEQPSPNPPRVTEDDLLAFQFKHFGDDSQPAEWFVSPEVALAYDPNHDPHDEDGLGYYPDGVKRTLTDADIEWFRARELHQMQMQQEKRDAERAEREAEQQEMDQQPSPAQQEQKPRRVGEEVPYQERKKRTWEGYIAGKDAVQGSLTHRRLARELDDQKVEAVEMDY